MALIKSEQIDSATPSGTAGGQLNGTYPNPSLDYGTSGSTACVGNDARLSDSRAPTGAAGGNLAGTYPNPTVAKIQTTTGPTDLTIGAIADGNLLARVSATCVGVEVPTPTWQNKNMSADTTTNDFDEACATGISATPRATNNSNGSYVSVFVNGIKYTVGDGVKTKDCYFSGNGGTTAKAKGAIVSGDKLYWVGSVAGFQLAASTDKIDFDYIV